MRRSHGTEATLFKRARAVTVVTGTLLIAVWALFAAPARADGSDSANWNGVNGAGNLPCSGGATQWNLAGFGNVQNTIFTSVVLTVNGQQFVFENPQNNNGSFQWDVPGPGTLPANTTASAAWSWTGDAPGNIPLLTISHCTGGTTTTTTTQPSTTSSTTSTTSTTSSTTGTTTSETTTSETTTPGTTTSETTTSETTTSSSTSVAPTTITPTDGTTPPDTTVAPTTVTPPGGTAFTGAENVIPLGVIALTLMTTGSGLMWLGTRRSRNQEGEG